MLNDARKDAPFEKGGISQAHETTPDNSKVEATSK